ncbi:MAG: V-type ATP synthase subunit I [Treponema sp.]|jgi:V/A-type H+-transporting ATPase subunit I|nr:V-type ATP synthase subunit I [Treponema sp.]
MIVPMKKLSLLVMDKNIDAALERIRELGIVHLERKTAASASLTKLLDRRHLLEIASGVLTGFTPKKKNNKTESPEYEGDLASHVVALSERRKKLLDYIHHHQREIHNFDKWGEFDPNDFKILSENGVNAHLYDISFVSYAKNVGDVPVIVLSKDHKNHSIRLLAFDVIPHETPFPLPDRPRSLVYERDEIRKTEMAKIETELVYLSPLKKLIDDERVSILADIEFETAKACMEPIDENINENETSKLAVSWISGYSPASDLGTLKRAASENGWALCAADPAEDDIEVPTKLKNNKFASLIYPLTNFLEMSPGYRETDISGWFMFFFTLFFGMIFGDAAYGAVLFLISIICIAKTSKKGTPLIFKFLLLMSLSNFTWGVLTCAWFGVDASRVPEILQNISLPLIVNTSSEQGWLAAYNAGNFWIQSGLAASHATIADMDHAVDKNLMVFCFTIALTQLSIAHIKGIFSNIRSLKVLSEVGQLGMLLGMYFIVLSLVVFNTGFGGVKSWQFYSLIGGFGLVFIFGNYEGNILKSLITSCANILTNVLGITNVFSDIMSYIRLWAVGLAGASIASTVDSFAGSMLSHLIFFAFGVALLVFGHSFNMVLNVLSVLVHGVRLNTLEFSSHVGLTWSGFAYKPFSKR